MGEVDTREATAARRLDAGSRTLRQIPPRAIEEARLRRAVTLAENVYTTLQQRYEEARLAEASTIPDVRILDAALVPRRPVRNTAPRMILLACFASLGLALVGAVLLDRADPRLRYPEQVSRDMGLTILGTIPHLRRAGKSRGAEPAPENVTEVVEALRGVCLNVSHAYGAAGPLVVTVTSPGAGDGKSFVSANLARTFSDQGHRVLLVDADIRRGVQHRRFNARRRPGLSDFLRGDATLDAIVQPTEHPSLGLIGCGVRATEAPERSAARHGPRSPVSAR
jgi:tyrosine-protein kinase Etk/Wzc